MRLRWTHDGRQRHDFGPARVGTVCRPVRRGWQPFLPARHRLVLPPRAGLILRPGCTGAQLPARLGYLALPPGTDLGAVLSTLSARVGVLDLSALEPADLRAAARPARLRVAALAAPHWMTAAQADQLRTLLGARTGCDAPAVLPPSSEGDVAALRARVAQAVSEHREVSSPDQPSAARALAATYLDVDRAGPALAVLAPLLAAEDGPAHLLAADALMRLDAPLAALAACEIAETAGPDRARAIAERADILRLRGAPGAATLAAEDALRENAHYAYALTILGFAYVACGQLDAASSIRQQLNVAAPGARDTLFLTGLIESARVRSGPAALGRQGRAEAAWHDVLADHPGDPAALRNLAAAQRRRRPWRAGWAETQLRAIDAGGPTAAGAGRVLADTVVAHPRKVAAAAAMLVGGCWFLLALNGGVPPVSLGWPLVAGALIGGAVFGLLRRRLPARARNAAKLLNRRGAGRVWAWYGGIAALGLALALPGVLLVAPDHSCGDSCVVLPSLPTLPSFPRFTFPGLPTFPAGPTFPSLPTFPSRPAFPSFPAFPT